MSGGIYTAVSGAVAQSEALDALADNVANASTAGHRAERVRFEQVLDRAQNNTSVRVVRGERDQSAGPVRETGRPLDLALDGPGSFVVDDGKNHFEVRSAAFQLNDQGQIVDASGRSLLDETGAAINVAPDTKQIAVDGEGHVFAGGEIVAKILISGASEEAPTRVRSGALEGSNTSVVRGMVEMIKVTRTYEALTRMIEGYKSIDERTAREIGNPR